MPVTVHKILLHSSSIIKDCILPIGQISEEAQEARNKDCRRFREHNTRKNSRINTNRDLTTMLLITSDPLINNYRESPCKSKTSLSQECVLMLKPGDPPSTAQLIQSHDVENVDIDKIYTVQEFFENQFDTDSSENDY